MTPKTPVDPKAAFTVGNKNSYEAALRQPDPLTKIGRREYEDGTKYEGGIVFRTLAEAYEYLEHHPELPWRPFRLVLRNGWADDVREKLPGESFHRLLNDALVLDLEKTS